jgi:hypothetical protein
MTELGILTSQIFRTRSAVCSSMAAVSALLPVLRQADVLRLVNCLETRLASAFVDGTHLANEPERRVARIRVQHSLDGHLPERGFFDVGYVVRLLTLNQRGRDFDLHLWTILSFEMWCRRFLDAPVELPKAAA